MIRYKMELTDEEKEILAGKQGPTLQKVMESVVLYGDAFGAKRLVEIEGPVHLVTSFGIPILKPVYQMMDELIEADISTKQPFTVDPRPIDHKNVKSNILQKLVFRFMYGKQKDYEEQLKKIGLKDDQAFTCTCYLDQVGNRPKKGQILAWAESSAVVFANSVLGARTNRNSAIIELLSGVLGKTPEFGLLTEEGRRAKWKVKLETSKLPNAQVLGSAVGMKVMEDVPYIIGLDKFLGKGMKKATEDYLKDLGAASASNGAVGLFHVENITPEAVEEGRGLLPTDHKTYVIDDQEIERVIKSYPVIWKKKTAKPKVAFIGCPHLSLRQLYDWTDKIESALKDTGKRKVKVRTVLSAAPDVVEEFKKDVQAYKRLTDTGATLTSICPLMYMNNPLSGRQAVITNSNKLRTYTTARFLLDDQLLDAIIHRRVKEVD